MEVLGRAYYYQGFAEVTSCFCFSSATTRKPPQLAYVSVEGVSVTAPGGLVGVLPDRVEAPASRERSDGTSVTSDNKRALVAKGCAVSGALIPPAGRGINHRIDTSAGAVGFDKVGDPTDHGSVGQAIARSTAGAMFKVSHSRQCYSIRGPATAVRKEVVGPSGTR